MLPGCISGCCGPGSILGSAGHAGRYYRQLFLFSGSHAMMTLSAILRYVSNKCSM